MPSSPNDPPFSAELVLRAYTIGFFPMAHPEENDAVYWYAPDPRAVLPLDAFHVPKNLDRLVKRAPFEVTVNADFTEVMRACADRNSTWISEEILQVYRQLHAAGFAHSVECRQDGHLVGGLYGVAIGGAFFGESMFHRASNASKVALVHLVRHLQAGGFSLLDVQFMTEHLRQFGAVEIPRDEYEHRLADALARKATF